MIRFKFTYQDRSLGTHVEIWRAQSWEDAIVLAFSLKPAEWKLLKVECLTGGNIGYDAKTDFSSKSFIAELEGDDPDGRTLWPKENPYLNKKEKERNDY